MQRRRQNWASNGRRDDEKRDTRDEFDDMEAFMSKKKRQLGDLKEENDRLRSEKGRLRADLARRSQAVAHLESQLKDAKAVAIKRCKTILDDAFAIFDVPAGGAANGKAARGGSAEDDESSDRSEYGVDPPADLAPVPGAAAPGAATASLPLAGPGDAAPSPAEKQEETPREQAPAEYVIPEYAIGGNDPH
jgi:regulator of replication initiation timing